MLCLYESLTVLHAIVITPFLKGTELRLFLHWLKIKKAPARHKSEDDYLLTTKLYCGKCKSFMVGENGTSHKNNKVHRYYKCVGVKYHRGCDKKTVKKDWIENLVIKVIKDIIFDDNLINNLADTLIEALGKESTVLPLLKQQLSDVEKSIDNMLHAIRQGIFTQSTKERLEELEQQKSDLSVRIIQEEMVKSPIDKDKIVFWLTRFRKLDTTNLKHKKRLIDSFINTIYLFDDRIIFTFNYKDGSKNITFDEIENSDLCSDLTLLGTPKLFAPVNVMFTGVLLYLNHPKTRKNTYRS